LASIEAGTFNIGVKVQGFDGGGSEWGVVRVPEPGTLLLFAAGVATLLRRRQIA
jgi:hypothetical protein